VVAKVVQNKLLSLHHLINKYRKEIEWQASQESPSQKAGIPFL